MNCVSYYRETIRWLSNYLQPSEQQSPVTVAEPFKTWIEDKRILSLAADYMVSCIAELLKRSLFAPPSLRAFLPHSCALFILFKANPDD